MPGSEGMAGHKWSEWASCQGGEKVSVASWPAGCFSRHLI